MRKFKCISTEENQVLGWGDLFAEGVVYKQAEFDPNIKEADIAEGALRLHGRRGIPLYVDPECFEEVGVEDVWKKYRRVGHSEMRPYIPGEDLSDISVAQEDSPEADLGMIARNPKNHKDQWYVARDYFEENLEEIKE